MISPKPSAKIGRPSTGTAKSGAQRMREMRARRSAQVKQIRAGLTPASRIIDLSAVPLWQIKKGGK